MLSDILGEFECGMGNANERRVANTVLRREMHRQYGQVRE